MSFHVLGRVLIILGSTKATKDLLEKRGNIYSDRPAIPFFEMCVHIPADSPCCLLILYISGWKSNGLYRSRDMGRVFVLHARLPNGAFDPRHWHSTVPCRRTRPVSSSRVCWKTRRSGQPTLNCQGSLSVFKPVPYPSMIFQFPRRTAPFHDIWLRNQRIR
jgi:hypothetical protein